MSYWSPIAILLVLLVIGHLIDERNNRIFEASESEHRDLCECWNWMTDSDRKWFAEQGVDDPRESRSR